jgi:hypothetical protein
VLVRATTALHEASQKKGPNSDLILKPNCSHNAPDDAYASSCIASNQITTAKQLTGHQNPSAPRRFLAVSSTQSHVDQRKSNTRATGQSANCFAKPTPLSSSTPFAKTSSIRKSEDEVETCFEEQSSSSPPLPTRLRFSSSLSRYRDAIDDASDGDEVLAASRPENVAEDDEDDLSDLLYLERLRDTKAPRRSEGEHDVHRFELMSRKRQRTSDAETAIDDVIAISSSLSPEQPYSGRVSDDDDFLEDTEAHADENFTSSPTGPTSALASSRFLIPTPAVFPTPTSSTRPSFKVPHGQNVATLSQSASSSLPDAFSPSRRRGKKDYILGGAADTVRSWVLALAAEESKAAQTYIERFRVVEIGDDHREGSCELVKDENGRRWLLINESAKGGGRGCDLIPRKVTVGCSVGIRASGAALNLRLDLRKQLETNRPKETKPMTEEWSIGIMWDILE